MIGLEFKPFSGNAKFFMAGFQLFILHFTHFIIAISFLLSRYIIFVHITYMVIKEKEDLIKQDIHFQHV